MNPKIIKYALFVGLIGGIAFCLFFLIIFAVYGNPFLPIKSNDFFIYLSLITAGLYIYRFNVSRDGLRYRQGLIIGLLSASTTLVISLTFLYVFLSIQPQILDIHAKYTIEQFENQKENYIEGWNEEGRDGSEIYRLTYANFQKRNWFNYLLREELIQKSFVSILLSLILSVLLRSRFLTNNP